MSKAWPVPGLETDAAVADNARKIIAIRFEELLSHSGWITDAGEVEQLHNARISAKRLRYTLEIFTPVFGDIGKSSYDQLATLQDALGVVHDLDVQIELMETELADPAAEQRAPEINAGLRSMIRAQRLTRSRQYREAQFAWNGIDLPAMRDHLLK